ncbi:hypothetical protein [Paracoccus sanguinis]|uniref:hypothetical protein n=1 Tax=Paracoccus sanguinis TaxID=1545044 RepID=UPI000AF5A6FE|nr:hypothetical protein [Paracoccus sanguinis]
MPTDEVNAMQAEIDGAHLALEREVAKALRDLPADLATIFEDAADAPIPTDMKRAIADLKRYALTWQRKIDAWYQTPEGRRYRNAKRRKVRTAPNADLSGMTEDEKAEHKRRQAAERMKKMRAKKKAAASGDLSAAIS